MDDEKLLDDILLQYHRNKLGCDCFWESYQFLCMVDTNVNFYSLLT